MMFNNWLCNIQDWLLPRLCPGCGLPCRGHDPLCPECRTSLPLLGPCCLRCALPYQHVDVHGVCGECQRHPPAFSSVLALYRYAPPIDHFIRALKFHQDLSMAALLGQALAKTTRELGDRPDVLVPVPLHPARLRERGYNQAVEIARPVSRALQIPMDINGIVRIRDTPSQTKLSKVERRRNLRRAFEARRDFIGQRIALVDDVMTTGETIDRLAAILRKAGATDVVGWVIARTPPSA